MEECGRSSGEEEGNAEYEGMIQPSQQHVAPCVKGVEWGLDRKGLRMVAAFGSVSRYKLHRRPA